MRTFYGSCDCDTKSTVNLADGGRKDIKAEVESMIKDIHEGILGENQIHAGYYDAVSKKLSDGVAKGLGGKTFDADNYKNTLKAYLDQNIFAFSAARSLEMAEQFKSFLTDESGAVRSWAQFKNSVISTAEVYNVSYLKTEYESAIANAQMAEKWEGLKQFPALQYSTVGDGNVRPEHAALDGLVLATDDPLWKTIYPPNAWGCRCNVVPASTNAKITNGADAVNSAKRAKIQPYFKRNVGEDKVIYNDGHPYFKGLPKELDAVKHYNMATPQRIYDMEDLPKYTSLNDKNEANQWWAKKAGDLKSGFEVKSIDNISITFDNTFRNHVFEDNKANRFKFINQIGEVLQNPDEVWSNRQRGSLQSSYIKYFDGKPMVIGVSKDRAVTMYELGEGEKPNFKAIENLRKGVLKYRSK